MQRTVELIYDGEVLRPVEPLDLTPHRRYQALIREVDPSPEPHPESGSEDKPARPLAGIVALARPLGVTDLAEQHDHYLYGTPKQ